MFLLFGYGFRMFFLGYVFLVMVLEFRMFSLVFKSL